MLVYKNTVVRDRTVGSIIATTVGPTVSVYQCVIALIQYYTASWVS